MVVSIACSQYKVVVNVLSNEADGINYANYFYLFLFVQMNVENYIMSFNVIQFFALIEATFLMHFCTNGGKFFMNVVLD